MPAAFFNEVSQHRGSALEAALSDEVSVALAWASASTSVVEVEAKKMARIKCHGVDIQILIGIGQLL
jgi:hypothetical protein